MPHVRRLDPRPSPTAAMTVRNLGANTAQFHILFDGIDLLGPDGPVDLVRRRAALADGPSPSALASAAWQLLCEMTHHDNPTVPGPRPHGPALYVGSAGAGFCDDAATVLAQLWQSLGLESRVWALDGHVVPEVLIAGHWEVHDPDLQVRYLTRGTVAGVKELSARPDLITSPEVLASSGRSAHALFNRYATHIANAYATARPEQIRHVDRWLPEAGSSRFHLTPGARITMPVAVPLPLTAGPTRRGGAVIEGPVHGPTTRTPLVSLPGSAPTAESDHAARHSMVNPALFSGSLELVGEVDQLEVRWIEPPIDRRVGASPAELAFDLPDLDARLRRFRSCRGNAPVELHDPVDCASAVEACGSGPATAELLRAIGELLSTVDPSQVSSLVAPVPLVSMALIAEDHRSEEVIDAIAAALSPMT